MTWIVGKNASILTFPKDFFIGRGSVGINHAAMDIGTDMAFSAYPFVIKMFLDFGITIDNIIGVNPICQTLQGQAGNDIWPNLYPGIKNSPVVYDNNLKGSLKVIAEEVNLAMAKNALHAYHNYGTALQLLMFWCALHGRYPMRLCGCNQTNPSMGGAEHNSPALSAESKEYTAEMIRCFNLHGDIVRLYENYDDCVEKEKYYASLCGFEK